MLGTEIIDLVEIIRKLVSRKEELDKAYFDAFVQPAWESFVIVHEDYMNSIKEYIGLLSRKDEVEIETIVKKISDDSIFSDNLRSELLASLEYMPGTHFGTDKKHLQIFIKTLIQYVDNRNMLLIWRDDPIELLEQKIFTSPEGSSASEGIYLFGMTQRYRIPLAAYLTRYGESIDREQAIVIFKKIALVLQSQYKELANNYHQLRKHLLS